MLKRTCDALVSDNYMNMKPNCIKCMHLIFSFRVKKSKSSLNLRRTECRSPEVIRPRIELLKYDNLGVNSAAFSFVDSDTGNRRGKECADRPEAMKAVS